MQSCSLLNFIDEWRAEQYQNITINFEKNEFKQSAEQLDFDGLNFRSKNSEDIHKRLANTVNEIRYHGAKKIYCIDTVDAARDQSLNPVFGFNRVAGTRNRFLWPLSGHQDIDDNRHLSFGHIDRIPFRNKRPQILWRGAANGHIEDEENFPTFYSIMQNLDNKGEALDYKTIERLSKIQRVNLMLKYSENPKCDFGFYPAPKKPYRHNPTISKWYGARASFSVQKEFRYLLVISGSDLATNFYKSLDTNSVVFKVGMKWEGFLDGQFEAWKHYVPIEADLSDLIEKFDWCEANIDACAKISKAAQEKTLLAKSKLLRKRYLSEIVSRYERDFFG